MWKWRRKYKKHKSISAFFVSMGRVFSEGFAAGIAISEISRDLTEPEIKTFISKVQGFPMEWHENTTKYDVIARLQYLQRLLTNSEDKYIDLKERYEAQSRHIRHQSVQYDVLEQEYEQMQEVLEEYSRKSSHVYAREELDILLSEATSLTEHSRPSSHQEPAPAGTVCVSVAVLEALMKQWSSLEEQLVRKQKREQIMFQVTNRRYETTSKGLTISAEIKQKIINGDLLEPGEWDIWFKEQEEMVKNREV